MSNETENQYTLLTRVLHWVSAAVILWATISGFYAALFAAPACAALLSGVNVSITALLTPVFALRIVNAIVCPRPAPLPLTRRRLRIVRAVHVALYALTASALLSGILMMETDIEIFDSLRIPRPLCERRWNHVFRILHLISVSALALLIVVHVGAVVSHELHGLRVLQRMTWRSKPRGEAPDALPARQVGGVALSDGSAGGDSFR